MEFIELHLPQPPKQEMTEGDDPFGGGGAGGGKKKKGPVPELSKPTREPRRSNASPFKFGASGGSKLLPSTTHPGHAGSSPTTSSSALPSNGRMKPAGDKRFSLPGPSTGPRRTTRLSAGGAAPPHYVEVDDDEDDMAAARQQRARPEALNDRPIHEYFRPHAEAGPSRSAPTTARKAGPAGHGTHGQPPLVAAAAQGPAGKQRRPREVPLMPLPDDNSMVIDVSSDDSEPEPQPARRDNRGTRNGIFARGPPSPVRPAPAENRQRGSHSRSSHSSSPRKPSPPPLDDTHDPIGDFTPTPPDAQTKAPVTKLDKGKGKAVANEAYLVAATSDLMARRTGPGLGVRKNMQGKDGKVPPPAPEPKPRPAKRTTNVIPSSRLPSEPALASLEACYVQIGDNAPVKILAGTIRVNGESKTPSIELFKKSNSDTSMIEITSIMSLMCCTAQEDPYCVLRVKLEPQELYNFQGAFLGKSLFGPEFSMELFLHSGTEGPKAINRLIELVQRQHSNIKLIPPTEVAEFRARHESNPSRLRRSEATEAARRASRAAEARREQEARRTSAAPPAAKSKTRVDPAQSKLEFPPAAPDNAPTRRSTRLTTTTTKVSDTDMNDIEEVKQAPKRQPRPDKNDVLFAYPLTGRVDLHITKDAKYRLQDGDFLNDLFIEFGLRHTLDEHPHLRPSVHLFNSFFYEKISSNPRKQKITNEDWPAYDSVKKWTKATNVFDKKFIILPINENLHWYFAVIYNPAGVLMPEGSSATSAALPAPESGAQTPQPEGSREESPDPLDIIDEVIPQDEVDQVEQGVGDIQIDSPAPEPAPEPAPLPITTPLFSMVQEQLAAESGLQQPEEAVASGDEQSKAKGTRDDYDIVGATDKTFIMVFDSLGGTHKSVGTNLKRWLLFEARHKLQREVDLDNAIHIEAKVPLQPNFSDCGVFLIHYVKMLLENQESVLSFVGKAPPRFKREEWAKERDEVWNEKATVTLRQEWIATVDEYTAKYNSLQDHNGNDAGAPAVESQTSVVLASQQQQQGGPSSPSKQTRSPETDDTVNVPGAFPKPPSEHAGGYQSRLSPSPVSSPGKQPLSPNREPSPFPEVPPRGLPPYETTAHHVSAPDPSILSDSDEDEDEDMTNGNHDVAPAPAADLSDSDPGDHVLEPMNILSQVSQRRAEEPRTPVTEPRHGSRPKVDDSDNEGETENMVVDEQPEARPDHNDLQSHLVSDDDDDDGDDDGDGDYEPVVPQPRRTRPPPTFKVSTPPRRRRQGTPYVHHQPESPSASPPGPPSSNTRRISLSHKSSMAAHHSVGRGAVSSSALPDSPEVPMRTLARPHDDLMSRDKTPPDHGGAPSSPTARHSKGKGRATDMQLGEPSRAFHSSRSRSHTSEGSEEPEEPEPEPAPQLERQTSYSLRRPVQHQTPPEEPQVAEPPRPRSRQCARKTSRAKPPTASTAVGRNKKRKAEEAPPAAEGSKRQTRPHPASRMGDSEHTPISIEDSSDEEN